MCLLHGTHGRNNTAPLPTGVGQRLGTSGLLVAKRLCWNRRTNWALILARVQPMSSFAADRPGRSIKNSPPTWLTSANLRRRCVTGHTL